jgi:hypothetical protein
MAEKLTLAEALVYAAGSAGRDGFGAAFIRGYDAVMTLRGLPAPTGLLEKSEAAERMLHAFRSFTLDGKGE